MKNWLFGYLSMMIVFSACGGSGSQKSDVNLDNVLGNIVINEVLAANKSVIKDPDFNQNSDYIELYNVNASSVDLSGYGLSDQEGGTIWKFPEGTSIEAKSYLLVWADKKNTNLHTDFKLSSNGEMVILYDKSETVIDKIVFGKQYDDVALGRNSNGSKIFLAPTANSFNNEVTNTISPTDERIIGPTPEIKTGLVFSEFMASNVNSMIDHDNYQFSDWIELYNNSNQPLNISGYTINDKNNSAGWVIPSDTIVPAKGFITVWADKEATGLHANFSLGSGGESLYLWNISGDMIDSVEFPEQKSNISYGRDLETFRWGYMLPSYESSNGKLYLDVRSKKPDFSVNAGFYGSSVLLDITSEDGGKIRYTVDGSIPDQNSPEFTGPFSLSKTTVVKAISYKDGLLPSKMKTATYFINEESKLPVVSLSTNSDYLYDDTIGIYVKGTNGAYRNVYPDDLEKYNFEQDWFRPVHISIFEDGQKMFSENIEFAISGGSSRYWNPKKSFRFEIDKKMDYKLYSTKNLEDIKDFKLRTGRLGYQIGDLLANALVADGALNVDYQAYKTVNMFMNGEYWGVYNTREKRGGEYIASNYPELDKNSIDVLQAGRIVRGNEIAHDQMRAFIVNNDLSISANYEQAIAMIDEDNFIDYLCVNLYSSNDDWVGSNNTIWKERKDGAKWRWMLDDVDGGFQVENANRVAETGADNKDIFGYVATFPSDTLLKNMFNAFSRNATFKAKFKSRFTALLHGVLSSENVLRVANQLLDERTEYITQGKYATSEDKYNNYVNNLRSFISQRNANIEVQLANF